MTARSQNGKRVKSPSAGGTAPPSTPDSRPFMALVSELGTPRFVLNRAHALVSDPAKGAGTEDHRRVVLAALRAETETPGSPARKRTCRPTVEQRLGEKARPAGRGFANLGFPRLAWGLRQTGPCR